MRRSTYELSQLRDACRKAQSVDDLKAILEAVIDHLHAVEHDHFAERARRQL
jgi:hypothetical protein